MNSCSMYVFFRTQIRPDSSQWANQRSGPCWSPDALLGLLVLMVLLNVGFVTPESGINVDWTAVPCIHGTCRVLRNTEARFDWWHNISGYVDLTWYYIGHESKPVLETIMFYTGNQVHIPKVGHRQNRLKYDRTNTTNNNQSAVMLLSDVTSRDNGRYKAQVTDPKVDKPGGFYIDNIAFLEVIPNSVFNFTLRTSFVDDSFLDSYNNIQDSCTNINLAVAENGSVIDIPDCLIEINPPARIAVRVDVNNNAPLPSIHIKHVKNEDMILDHPICRQDYICERYLYFDCGVRHTCSSGSIHVFINFGVQNQPIVMVQLHIAYNTAHTTTTASTPRTISEVTESTKQLDSTDCDKPQIECFITPGGLAAAIIFPILIAVGLGILIGWILLKKYRGKKENKPDITTEESRQLRDQSV